MARRKKGRLVNGILILDKPTGITSNAALQKVKRLFEAQKAGHTGSLDPLATGVLPVCLGEATKLSHYLLDANKRYRAKCILGISTTTGDSQGEILAHHQVPETDTNSLLTLLDDFKGTQNQTPPMYSALKHNGRPLYEYARKGIEIERKSRQITIFELNLLEYNVSSETGHSSIEIDVLCSKGTYIRSLAEPFKLSQAVTLEQLEELPDVTEREKLLLPVDSAISAFPEVHLDSEQKTLIEHGHEIDFKSDNKPATEGGNFRLYFNNTLIALAILDENRKLKPKRLIFL